MPDEEHSIQCPSCLEGILIVNSMLYTVPYFNEIAMFTMKCPKCSFNHNDIFSAEERPPVRWTLRVTDPEMLNIRVVRSGSGTIRFPDFGIDIEPGPAAESYISNVEGVLYRTRPTVEFVTKTADLESEREQGKKVLEMMMKAIRGELDFTMIIEDPMGVSGILPDDLRLVKREEISREDAANLRGAPTWLDTVRKEVQQRKG
ncbi:MAG: ZPR1 zinc finger domain-containing protein [Candidatus Thorarchaeota archaeon]|nr:ZPR1 zinc finger domain-containing protein [Candidatus Thorarchaeota archaeon]